MDVVKLLRYMADEHASDLHLKPGQPPVVRIDGELRRAPFEPLTPDDAEAAATQLLSRHKEDEFRTSNEADAAFSLSEVGRFRVNAFRQRGSVGLAVRRIRTDIPTFEELHLPPAAAAMAQEYRGLVLVTGPAGTGKTTTIAAMLGWINRNRTAHIVTIEDPIEILHRDDRSIIDQREIGMDTASYRSALRHVVRQDPDVIFIGEVRDVDTVEAAIQAAETGHLVISTLHTLDATETVNRMIDLFPTGMQRQVRAALSSSLRGILCQRLVPRADGTGRVPAVEVLINTGRVSEKILHPEHTWEIPDVIAEGSFYGMQTFDQSLVELVRSGLVTPVDAAAAASQPHDFELKLRAEQLA